MKILIPALSSLLLQACRGFSPFQSARQQTTTTTTTRTTKRTLSSAFSALNVGGGGGSNANEIIPMRQGSSVAIVTPMTETGSIDLSGLRNLLQWHVEAGTDNLCILGTTGEASVMTMEERAAVLKTAVDVVKGKIPILVGTGTINPESVKSMTQQAIDLGCDASLVVSPYYVKPPQRCLIKHFIDAADLGLPVVVYNIPGRTGINFEDKNMALISEHDNIVGLKDATGDLERLKNMKRLVPSSDDLLIYSGDDGSSLDFVLAGGDGCISVTANILPKTMKEIMKLALNGEVEKAKELNLPLEMLHDKLFVESNPIPAKWCLKRMNKIKTAYCRPPLDEMDSQYNTIVEKALIQARALQVQQQPSSEAEAEVITPTTFSIDKNYTSSELSQSTIA